MQDGQLIHATSIAFEKDGRRLAVLLRGAPGSGKSDLALRCIESGLAELIADDQTLLVAAEGSLLASPPHTIAGRIEVRGVGVVRYPFCTEVPVGLLVDLVPRVEVPRLPDSDWEEVAGVRLPRLSLHAFDASTPTKLALATTRPERDIDR